MEKVVDNLTENQQEILKLVKNDKYVSAREISTKIGISSRKTQENIKKLKENGLLERIGPAKGGYWKIVETSKQYI
ncbi:MAG: winged helix-turn-helix transcriptional regulator [Bacteroidetes bacterium]|nr:winged helix-turn-helix transcriptional regulator [Bacteroidota bacterium]